MSVVSVDIDGNETRAEGGKEQEKKKEKSNSQNELIRESPLATAVAVTGLCVRLRHG